MANRTIKIWLIWVFITVSFLGFLDATYLVIEHYRGVIPPCSIIDGCERVLNSEYAVLGGVPVALFGSIYYLAIFILSILYLDTKKERFINFAAHFTIIGFIASLWLIYLQIFIIKSFCFYCVLSAAFSITLFIFGLLMLKYRRNIGLGNFIKHWN